MDGETTMTTNGRAQKSEPNVAASFSELTHDVILLAELQAELFAADIKDTSQKARSSLMLGVVGVCVMLGSIPVALFALAELLHEQVGWSSAASFGVATLVGVVISVSILAAAWARFKTGLGTLHRSRDELRRNVAWVKSSLRNRVYSNHEEKD